jgi:hypothetical protein
MDVALEKDISGFSLGNEAQGLSRKTIDRCHRNRLLLYKWMEKDIGHSPQVENASSDPTRNCPVLPCNN